jgi:hypothetical protein
VVKGIDRDKASGPDGFFMALYQDCWEVIKFDLIRVFFDFYARGKFECHFCFSHFEGFRGFGS